MDLYQECINYAKLRPESDWPPGIFIRLLNLNGSSPGFIKAAWALFKEKQQMVSAEEVAQSMQERGLLA